MRKINTKIELNELLDIGFEAVYADECIDCLNLGYHCGLDCPDAQLDDEWEDF